MKGNKPSAGKVQPSIQSFFASGTSKKSRPTKGGCDRHTQAREPREEQQRTTASTQDGEKERAASQQTKRDRSEEIDVVICDGEPTEKRRRPCSAPTDAGRDMMRHELAQRKFAIRRQNLVQDKKVPVPSKGAKFTPLEQQVIELKQKHPGMILLVECGYKFRFFGEDADVAAKNLNIYSFADHNFMTASVPIHRLSCHVKRLVRKGYKVALARQMETAALKAASESRNKVFVRKVTAVYTPATLEAGVFEDSAAEAVENNQPADISPAYLVAVSEREQSGDQTGGVTFTAVEPAFSTIWWGNSDGHVASSTLESMLMYFQPKEILACGPLSPGVHRMLKAFADTTDGTSLEAVDVKQQSPAAAAQELMGMFSAGSQAADSIASAVPKLPGGVVDCMAASFGYLKCLGLEVWNEAGLRLQSVEQPGVMTLSSNALANLHVFVGDDGTPNASLIRLLSRTRSQAGAKLFRQWLANPLVDASAIRERQDAVQSLLDDFDLHSNVQEALQACPDVDRSIGRAFLKRIKPSEFYTAMSAMSGLPGKLLGAADGVDAGDQGIDKYLPGASLLLQSCLKAACNSEMVTASRAQLALLDEAAAQDSNFTTMFTSEQDFPEVFECQRTLADRERALQDLLPGLAQQARVQKVSYTSIMNQGDCLIELPTDLKAPASWVRICATKKVNRFRPPEVATAMAERDQASERLQAQCKQSWAQLLERFALLCPMFRAAAHGLAVLDCLQSLAAVASTPSFCRPEILDDDPRLTLVGAAGTADVSMPGEAAADGPSSEAAAGACRGEAADRPEDAQARVAADATGDAEALIDIREGRAPLLDDMLPQGAVPNDVLLRGDGLRAMCISGPNMGGKSSYMCQVAQLVLMAQIGAWVPATAMRIRPVDAIHTRMGAHDNILQGRSTFLEELLDASRLLAASTPKSLVILDELGRGTSTYDGVAIAAATLEHLVRVTRCCALFVTHYPEVCEVAESMRPHAQSFHMAYKSAVSWDLLEASPSGAAVAATMPDTENSSSANNGVATAKPGHDRAQSAKPQPIQVPKIVFLYKLAPGAAGASFGLNVALMAGLPQSVVARASTLASFASSVNQTGCVSRGDAVEHAARKEVACGEIAPSCSAVQDLQTRRSSLYAVLRAVIALPARPDASLVPALQGKVEQVLHRF